MKIVHVCLCGPMTDGWNYQENLLTRYHKIMGLDVVMVASEWIWGTGGEKEKSAQHEYVNEDGVKVIRIPLLFGTVDTRLKLYKGLQGVLEREQPDIIFVHDVQFLDVLTITRYIRKRKRTNRSVRVFVDNHVDYSNGASNWLSKNILHKVIWRFVANRIEPYTEKFYGVLPARVEFLKELYRLPEEKCELLVMGADDKLLEEAKRSDARSRIRKQYNIGPDDFLIVTGGKIDEFKQQTILLMEAVRNIHDPKVRLLVFGSVSDGLKEQVNDLNDGEKVQYIGWINAADSYQYFEAADLVVFPGRHSVFWEQVAAQGIPMVCKEWNGTKHVDLGGNVVFLKEDTAKEIQEVLEAIRGDQERYLMMQAMAAKGKEVFSYRAIAERAIVEQQLQNSNSR